MGFLRKTTPCNGAEARSCMEVEIATAGDRKAPQHVQDISCEGAVAYVRLHKTGLHVFDKGGGIDHSLTR